MNFLKFVIPKFPDTKFLEENWWYRFIKVIGLTVSILLNLAALFILIQTVKDFVPCLTREKITVEELGRRAKDKHVQDFIPGDDFKPPLPKSDFGYQNGIYLSYGKYTTYDMFSDLDAGNLILKLHPVYQDAIIGYNCFNKISSFFIGIMIGLSLLGFFVVNLICRLALYIVFNDKWK